MAPRGRAARVELRQWEFLNGEYFSSPDNQALTLPAGTTAVSIEVAGSYCYYAINRNGAGVTSHGYMPDGGQRSIGPLANLNTMHVHAPLANSVHVQYYREA